MTACNAGHARSHVVSSSALRRLSVAGSVNSLTFPRGSSLMVCARSDSTSPAPLCSRFPPRLPAFACMTCVTYGHKLALSSFAPAGIDPASPLQAVATCTFVVCARRNRSAQSPAGGRNLLFFRLRPPESIRSSLVGGHNLLFRRLRPPELILPSPCRRS